jgi:methyl-accepting chemotaxis protein
MDLSNRLKMAEQATVMVKKRIAAEGPIRLEGDRLFAGSTLLNGHTAIVDAVYDATLFGSTIFVGNVRIATRAAAKGSTERALGTRTNDEVTTLVFTNGGTFRGTTETLGKTWVIVYVPLDDATGQRVGMVAAWRELVAAS